ncbi:MAG: Re/Si-specific NAD(P)(+) transhydrogenase subunit alpha [Balneolaceae bacterium]
MIFSICKETADLEKRVALTPESAGKLVKQDIEILIESGAGTASSYTDDAYRAEGAGITADRDKLFGECDLLMAVNTPPEKDLIKMKQGSVLICFLWALQHPDLVDLLEKQKITALALDAVPRISRAQSMDALSSMSNIAGYRSALIGAGELNRYLPMMMTAAGTIPPAKVLVMGAGVAGLQAIATAKRLGAVVESYDIRPAVKEQVESLGAKFVEVPLEEEETETTGGYAREISEKNQQKQKEVMADHVKKSDIVITTALIPGKKAPVLVSKEMVNEMKPGSVVVDIAAEQGGNCEVTEAGKTIVYNGVKVCGPLNLPSTLAYHASQLYAKNMLSLLSLLIRDNQLVFDFEDEIVKQTTITHEGDVISPLLTAP